MTRPNASDRRAEGRDGKRENRRLPRYAAASLVLHAGFLVLVGTSLPTTHLPVLAEPLYEVALVPSPVPNYVPPKPARSTEAPPEKKPVPPREEKPDPVPVTPKPVAKPSVPKEPEKQEESISRKPPQKRPAAEPVEETPASVPSPPTPSPPGEVSMGRVEQQDFRDDWYRSLICRRLSEEWIHKGIRPGANRSTVRFIIHRDGSITDVALVQESGSSVYDRAALAAVYAVQKSGLLPLPDAYAGDVLTVYMDFIITGEGGP